MLPRQPRSSVSPRAKGLRRLRGFTLIETALATVIVGVGVLGMMQLLSVCTQQNRGGAQTTTAIYLAQCVQEMLADLPFNDPSGAGFGLEENGGILTWDDIDDFHGLSTTPIDSQRNAIKGLDQYTQVIDVTEVSANNLSLALPGSDCKRVTVRVLYRRNATDTPSEVYRLSWIRTR